jgi:hypothetical protein
MGVVPWILWRLAFRLSFPPGYNLEGNLNEKLDARESMEQPPLASWRGSFTSGVDIPAYLSPMSSKDRFDTLLQALLIKYIDSCNCSREGNLKRKARRQRIHGTTPLASRRGSFTSGVSGLYFVQIPIPQK